MSDDEVLKEMQTLVNMDALATAATVRRWLTALERSGEDDVTASARDQARRDTQ